VPPDLAEKWAENLYYYRKRAGYETQADLAEALGCTRAAVSSWEQGKRAPSPIHQRAIAKLLGLTAGFLFPAS